MLQFSDCPGSLAIPEVTDQSSVCRVWRAHLPGGHWRPQTSADGQILILGGLDQEEILHVGNPLRHLRGKVVGLRPVFIQVVELLHIILRFHVAMPVCSRYPRNTGAGGVGKPAVLINAAAPHDVEELRRLAEIDRRLWESFELFTCLRWRLHGKGMSKPQWGWNHGRRLQAWYKIMHTCDAYQAYRLL